MLVKHLDPQRSPDWRSQLVQQAADIRNLLIDPKMLDQYVRSDPDLNLLQKAQRRINKESEKAVKALRLRQNIKRIELPYDIQLIVRAQSLINEVPRYSKFWLYKGLVLGRAPVSIISELLGESTDVLSILNRIYFEVEDRLDDEVFIWNQVIGTDPTQGLHDNVDALWQECGFLAGHERMLYLSPQEIRKNAYGLYETLWTNRPTLEDYLLPGNAAPVVQQVARSRMKPDPSRTIASLRQLYYSLPKCSLENLSVTAAETAQQDDGIVKTYFIAANNQTGELERKPAVLLPPSKELSNPNLYQESSPWRDSKPLEVA